MRLIDQVTSLETSKRLKELGVEQDSLFYWWQPVGYVATDNHILIYEQQMEIEMLEQSISAFTVAELGELIDARCNEWAQGYNDCTCEYTFQYGPRGAGAMIEGIGKTFTSDLYSNSDRDQNNDEAEARGQLLIHMLENDKG